ncbi:MAG: LysR family transcriptional regulator [Clostridiales Family XIII bacterium]|jgi:DNA-binding transcriptional LysR family regulator|nr:LysR family transcriptional regulator [Clostridiales Family XIII bacterium]
MERAMNMLQIKYFLTAAACLNFTQAADLLYITQPALSRQMIAIEKELGTKLFVRTNRSVKLTRAGRYLFENFGILYGDYERLVEKMQGVAHGLSGSLNIGILDGTYVSDLMPSSMKLFTKAFPYVDITLRNHSFNSLAASLYDGRIDLALTLFFDIENRQNIAFRILEKSRDHIAVHRRNPLAARGGIRLSDIGAQTFIISSTDDSEKSAQLILDGCRAMEFLPKIKYSPDIQTSMLWVQADIGVVMLDSRNTLRADPQIKFLDVNQVSNPSLTAAWHQSNNNPFIPMFVELLLAAAQRGKGASWETAGLFPLDVPEALVPAPD